MTVTPPESLDALANEFNRMIGQCITQWALIQEELFLLCFRVLESTIEHAAIVYYRTPSIEARLSLTGDLIEAVLPKRARPSERLHEDAKQWRDIDKEFRKLLAIRNQIAHHPVWATYRMFDGNRIDISGFEIYESQHERYRGKTPKLPVQIKDLRSHLNATNKLVFQLVQFRETIVEHVRAFVSQGPRPMLLQD